MHSSHARSLTDGASWSGSNPVRVIRDGKKDQVLNTPHSDAAIRNENRSQFTVIDSGETI